MSDRQPILDQYYAKLEDRIEALEALLRELIDIEGPQPGTSDWANKVRAALEPEQTK